MGFSLTSRLRWYTYKTMIYWSPILYHFTKSFINDTLLKIDMLKDYVCFLEDVGGNWMPKIDDMLACSVRDLILISTPIWNIIIVKKCLFFKKKTWFNPLLYIHNYIIKYFRRMSQQCIHQSYNDASLILNIKYMIL